VTNLKDLVMLAEELGINMEGLDQEELTKAVEEAMFGHANPTAASTVAPKTIKSVKTDDLTAEQQMIVTMVLNSEEIKADKIRRLLQAGIPKGKIAKLLDVRYQQVYQVEQRMLEEKERE